MQKRKGSRQIFVTLGIAAISFLLGAFVVSLSRSSRSDTQSRSHPPFDSNAVGAVVPYRSPAFGEITALPYVDSTFDPNSNLRGVLINDPEKSYPGYGFYNSGTARAAHLIDRTGRRVHTWSYETPEPWQSAELLPSGDILVIEMDAELARIDLRSRLQWALPGRFHHDLAVHDGKIFALSRTAEIQPKFHSTRETLVDYMSVISLEGEIEEKISILDLILKSEFSFLLPSIPPLSVKSEGVPLDILHMNHIEIFDGRLETRSSLFKRGNWLLSSRSLNAIFIVDGETREILWLWGPGNLTYQHHPHLLPNGNLLIFNNGFEKSSVLELDPLSLSIVWSYRAQDFYSRRSGSVQRLANGNTLITESDTGYVIEVTPDGEVAWKFSNPDVDNSGNRSTIWRMTKYDPTALSFLRNSARN